MQTRLHGSDRDPQRCCHVGQRHPKEVVQDDDRSPLVETPKHHVEQLTVGDDRRCRRSPGRGSASVRPRSDAAGVVASVDARIDGQVDGARHRTDPDRESGQIPPGSDERLLDRVAREFVVPEDQPRRLRRAAGWLRRRARRRRHDRLASLVRRARAGPRLPLGCGTTVWCARMVRRRGALCRRDFGSGRSLPAERPCREGDRREPPGGEDCRGREGVARRPSAIPKPWASAAPGNQPARVASGAGSRDRQPRRRAAGSPRNRPLATARVASAPQGAGEQQAETGERQRPEQGGDRDGRRRSRERASRAPAATAINHGRPGRPHTTTAPILAASRPARPSGDPPSRFRTP